MPGCVLRVRSKTTRVEELIDASGLRPIAIHKKGQPRSPRATTLSRSSGFNVDVSRGDGDIAKQSRDAVRFLKRHSAALARLRRQKTFAGMALDFGIWQGAVMDVGLRSYLLPIPLLALAGKHGIEIELSFYSG